MKTVLRALAIAGSPTVPWVLLKVGPARFLHATPACEVNEDEDGCKEPGKPCIRYDPRKGAIQSTCQTVNVTEHPCDCIDPQWNKML